MIVEKLRKIITSRKEVNKGTDIIYLTRVQYEELVKDIDPSTYSKFPTKVTFMGIPVEVKEGV